MAAIILIIIIIFVFIKTLSYGIFEIRKNSNTIGGIITIVIAVIALIFPNIMVYINGFY